MRICRSICSFWTLILTTVGLKSPSPISLAISGTPLRRIKDQTTDRVRHLPLPKLDFDVVDPDVVLLASDSRIFLLCGQTGWGEPNGILSIDTSRGNNNDLSWKRCDEWALELSQPLGASVFRNEINGTDCIYVVILHDKKNEVLCFCLESGTMTWCSDHQLRSKLISSVLPLVLEHSNSTSNCKVVVGEVLICFLPWSPLDKSKNHCPALYVYNISKKEWLSEPVRGLPNNGVVLPLLLEDYKYEPTMENPSLFQVRTGARKLALVWSISSKYANIGTQVHWTKFTLNEKELRAEDLSSGTFDAGNAHLIKSTTG